MRESTEFLVKMATVSIKGERVKDPDKNTTLGRSAKALGALVLADWASRVPLWTAGEVAGKLGSEELAAMSGATGLGTIAGLYPLLKSMQLGEEGKQPTAAERARMALLPAAVTGALSLASKKPVLALGGTAAGFLGGLGATEVGKQIGLARRQHRKNQK